MASAWRFVLDWISNDRVWFLYWVFGLQEARRKIWMYDVDGLLTTTRKDGNLDGHKKFYAKDHPPIKDLGQTVKEIKPTVNHLFHQFHPRSDISLFSSFRF